VKSSKNVLILVLVLTTVGGAVVSWRQHLELIALRAAAMNHDERGDWQKRLRAAEKSRHDLETQVATLQREDGDPTDAAAPSEGAASPRRRFGPGRNRFAAVLEQPEAQKLIAMQQKAALDRRYASLFKNLHLTPEQLDQFKDLLVEKQSALGDVMRAARAQGLNPRTDREGFKQLVASTEADIDNTIKSTLGDAAYAQYQQYQQTLPERNVTGQLQQALSYTGTPLSDAQSEQLVQILAANAPASHNSNAGMVRTGPGDVAGGGPPGRITDAAVIQAQGVLSAPQLEALKQLQQTQQAQTQLRQLFRDGANRPAAPAAPAASGG
jgi:hypothetical protein